MLMISLRLFQVAIKIISKKNAPVEYLKKFMPREIDALNATCRHPNVVSRRLILELMPLANQFKEIRFSLVVTPDQYEIIPTGPLGRTV